MSAQIRPSRLDVTDRFPMLAFSLTSAEAPRVAEVVLASDLELFAKKDGRNSGNFFTSRELGQLLIPAGGAVYTVPPQVLARFIAADRLYFALATTSAPGGQDWQVDVMPGEASPYVSLRSLTDRALRRVRMFPSAPRTRSGAPTSLTDWAGDHIAAPVAAKPAAPAASPQAPAAGAPSGSSAPAASVPYNDGFGPLPPLQPAVGSPPAAAAPPMSAPPASPPTAQGLEIDPEQMGIEGPLVEEPETALGVGQADNASPLTQADYTGVTRLMPSPAFTIGRRGTAIDRIVIHITSSGQSPYNGSHFTRVGANSSAHYMVNQLGEIFQFVREQDTAWHARAANRRSIGIEHVAVERGGARYGSHIIPYTPPTQVELETSAALVAHLCRKYGLTPDRTFIVGHNEIDANTTHSLCPTGAWDWDGYMALVAAAYAAAPPTGVGDTVAQGLSDGEVDPETRGIEAGTYDEAVAPEATAAGLAVTVAEYGRVARVVPSPAFTAGRSNTAIDRIVIHITDAPTTSSTVNTFSAPGAQASAHYLVGQDGEIVQFVSETDTAWHARGANRRSIGIEHVAIKSGGADYPRRDGTMQHYDALPPSDIQYSESAALVSSLCQKYGLTADRTTIIGHNEADPTTTHGACPTGNWDWDHYMNLVTNQISAPQPVGQGLGLRDRKPTASAMVFGQEDFDKINRLRAADWRDLFQWHAPASIRSLVEGRGFHIQTIEDAVGDLNLDFYKVRINRFPPGVDAPELLRRFITDTNSFLDSNICGFDPYGPSDVVQRLNTDPVGTCLKLDINRGAAFYDPRGWDDAAIVISDKGPHGQPTQFYSVTTINTPDTGDHPVSGHRQFGFYTEDGITYFYSRGADRATLGFPGTEGAIYSGGEQLWQSFQRTTAATINSLGGDATIVPPVSERFNPGAIRASIGYGEAQSLGQGLAVRALDAEDWSINWDGVEQIAQPTDMGCWATAAAMLIGWRDQQSVDPTLLARYAGCEPSLDDGLTPAVKRNFAARVGLVVHPNACFTPEGFRDMLEANGPVWVTAKVIAPSRFIHAVVVTGMYRSNGAYFVRITDPLDRVVGSPGNPGARTDPATHVTGSRYIMGWDDFTSEFEAAGDVDRIQLLHTGGAHGHVINRGSAAGAGYALGLGTARGFDAEHPPKLRLRSEPEPGDLVAATSRRTISENGRNYDLAQVAGMIRPANALAGGAGMQPIAGERVALDDWPYIDGPGGRSQAGVAIDWKFDGAAVGDVAIAPVGGSLADGWQAVVRADIGPGASTLDRTVLIVRVTTVFSRPGEQDQTGISEVTLSGEGRATPRHCGEPDADDARQPPPASVQPVPAAPQAPVVQPATTPQPVAA